MPLGQGIPPPSHGSPTPQAMAWLSKLGQLTADEGRTGGRLTIGPSWKPPWPRRQQSMPPQPDPAVVRGIAFVRDVVDACWDAELKSALAPVAVMLPLLSAWGGSPAGKGPIHALGSNLR